MKMFGMKSMTVFLFAALSLASAIFGLDEGKMTVEGIVVTSKNGPVYLVLYSESNEDSRKGDSHSLVIQVPENGGKKQSMPFKISGIQPGQYGIKAFQDLNGNGKLDSGRFGPTEPYGFYKDVRPLFRGPTFEEIAFTIERDMKGIRVILK